MSDTKLSAGWEALASQALVAALVIAPPGAGYGSRSVPEFELRYLDAEPDKADCRELSAKGWQPVLLLAWTATGLKFEYDKSLLEWPPCSLAPFIRTASLAFMAWVTSKPADRARMN